MGRDQRGRGWALALTSVAFFMVALDALVVITALPTIGRDLHASLSTLEWTVNAYALTTAAGIITAAALGDRFGRRRVFTVGLALFTAASAACALAPTAGTLVAARAVQGLGAAVVIPLSLTLLSAAFPAERRGAIVGIWGGIAGIAVASGPLVGGAVTEGLDWHWIFWVNVPLGLAAFAFAPRRLAESHGPLTQLDLPGVLLGGGGTTALVWAPTHAATAGWSAPGTLAGLVLGLAGLAGFLRWEGRAVAPMLPLRLFRRKAFAVANAAGFLQSAALMGAVFLASQYFQGALGYTPLGTGLRFLPWTATPLLVAPLAGRLCDRFGARPVLVTGLLVQGIGLGWFAVAATAGPGYRHLVLPLIVAGAGVSAALPATPAAVLGAVAPADLGKASGVNNTLQRLGGAFGIAVGAAVYTAGGFRPAIGVAAGLSVLGAGLATGLANRPTAGAAGHRVEPSPGEPVRAGRA